MENIREETVNELLARYNKGGKPFLVHLQEFKGEEGITACSIGQKWTALSGENSIATYGKGRITIAGANESNPEYKSGGCPWKKKYEEEEMMNLLKHACDTGIVNQDGSINIDSLKDLIRLRFSFHEGVGFCIKKSVMDAHLDACAERDENLAKKMAWYLPGYKFLAQSEWDTAYDIFTDIIVDDERALTIETFFQFYFEPRLLFERTLSGELPVKK